MKGSVIVDFTHQATAPSGCVDTGMCALCLPSLAGALSDVAIAARGRPQAGDVFAEVKTDQSHSFLLTYFFNGSGTYLHRGSKKHLMHLLAG